MLSVFGMSSSGRRTHIGISFVAKDIVVVATVLGGRRYIMVAVQFAGWCSVGVVFILVVLHVGRFGIQHVQRKGSLLSVQMQWEVRGIHHSISTVFHVMAVLTWCFWPRLPRYQHEACRGRSRLRQFRAGTQELGSPGIQALWQNVDPLLAVPIRFAKGTIRNNQRQGSGMLDALVSN